MTLSQHIWKKDENQIQSAIKIIEQYDDIKILLTVEDSGVTMISFNINISGKKIKIKYNQRLKSLNNMMISKLLSF